VCVIQQAWCQIQRTSPSSCCVNCGIGYLQSIYSSAYLSFNIQLQVSTLLLVISRQLDARYTANIEPNIVGILQFTLCEMWFRTYIMNSQLRMFRIQYSTAGICAAIVDNTSILCALYCKHFAKCSAHPPAFAMRTVVPRICKVFTAPHIQAAIFN
jgi:hypothetical protein